MISLKKLVRKSITHPYTISLPPFYNLSDSPYRGRQIRFTIPLKKGGLNYEATTD